MKLVVLILYHDVKSREKQELFLTVNVGCL